MEKAFGDHKEKRHNRAQNPYSWINLHTSPSPGTI